MLKPKYIARLGAAMLELYSACEQEILADMARRIAAADLWIPATDWQYQKLIEGGNFHSYIVQALAARTDKTRKEIERLMQEAGAKSLSFDTAIYREAGLSVPPLAENRRLRQLLQAGLAATNQTMKNLTRSTAKTATGQFEDALDLAWMQVQSGAFSPAQAVKSAVKRLAEQGVSAVQYPSGHRDSLEVAVRRATITGVNQTCLQLQDALAAQMGVDLVETTAHAGARPSHALWQGQIFSRSGKSAQYPDFVQVTGYGSGDGLGGWNCSHSFRPYIEGMPRTYSKDQLQKYEAKDYEYHGERLSEYEALQMQRSIERKQRKWKREFAGLEAAGLPTEEAAAKIALWNGRQRDFLQETGLKRQQERESVAGWGRSRAARASGVVRRNPPLTNAGGKPILIAKKTDIQAVPNSITQVVGANGGISRNYYDQDGRWNKQITNNAHGNLKNHPFGQRGEHAHDVIWEDGKIVGRPVRELGEAERKDNSDIL